MQNERKNLTDVVNEIKVEAKEFVSTRLQMFNMEMKEKLSAWKIGIPLLILLYVLNIVFVIIASIQAGDGKLYRYPMAIRFIK